MRELAWPDKPAVTCDMCSRAPEPGSALCAGCADRVWMAERDATEDPEVGTR